MVKYSIILLAYDPEGKLADMTKKCISAIIDNSIGRDYELLIHTEGGGYLNAVNLAFEQARGEYIIFICNDVVIKDKNWLERFAIPGKIGAWHISTNYFTELQEPDASCFCIPRDVREKIGFLDPRFNEGYGFDDVDYFLRARELGIEFVNTGVQLEHASNITFKTYFSDTKEGRTSRNESLFKEKWQGKVKFYH